MSIVTVSEFKEYLQGDPSDTSKDNLLQALINGAEKNIEAKGLKLSATDITDEKHDWASVLYTNFYPVNSITNFTVDGISLSEDVDFFVYPDFIRVNISSNQLKSVTISYNAGFSVVPEDVKTAIKMLTAYDLKANDPIEPNTQSASDSRLVQGALEKLRNYLRMTG